MCASRANLPFEILENILIYTNGTTIINCRMICKPWKEFIDVNEVLWKEICLKEYKHASRIAKKKCGNDLSWKDLYRNLKMWPKITKSHKTMRKFYNFTTHHINHALDIDNSLLVLRETQGMVLYDMNTLKNIPVVIPENNCVGIANCEIATVILTNKTLYLQRNKMKPSMDTEASFKADKFILMAYDLYFNSLKNGIYHCNLKGEKLDAKLIIKCEYDVAEMDMGNGVLFIFTICGKILGYKNGTCCVKALNCPSEWVRNIRHIRAFDDQNIIGYSRNIFYLETDQYKHVSLDFPPITALFFYGDIVLIGTKGGDILMYRLSEQTQSTKPMFQKVAKMPEKTYAMSLDVYEKRTGPVIVASTFFDIILIEVTFFPEEAELSKRTEITEKIPMYKRLLKLKHRLKKE